MMDERASIIVLENSFKYLETMDIMRASRVSQLWYQIATRSIYWRTVMVGSSCVVDSKGLVQIIKDHGSKTLDLRNPSNTPLPSPPIKFWRELTSLLNSVTSLSSLYLGECPLEVVEWLQEEGPLKETLRFLSIECRWTCHDPLITCPTLDSKQLINFNNLEEFHFIFNGEMRQLKNIYCFSAMDSSNSLKCLSIKTVGCPLTYPTQCGPMLLDNISADLVFSLMNLKKLSLDNCGFGWDHVLCAVAAHETLTELELLNFKVSPTFHAHVAMCTGLKKLFIVPSLDTVFYAHQIIIDSVLSLRESLAFFTLGFYREFLKTAGLKLKDALKKVSADRDYENVEKMMPKDRFPFMENHWHDCSPYIINCNVYFITLNELRAYMSRLFDKSKTEVIELP